MTEKRLNEPVKEQDGKKRAYASELTDTLGHKLGKNQLIGYTQQQLFTEDMYGRYVYLTVDGQTEITADPQDETPLKPLVSPATEKVLTLILTQLNDNFNGTNRIYLKDITADEMREKTTIAIALNDYMEKVGITDTKTARANLKKASDELYNKSIKHTFYITQTETGKNGKTKTKREPLTLEFRLLEARATFKNGNVLFYMSQRATPYLTEYSETYNEKLLKVDIHDYPHAYKIGHYLSRQNDRSRNSRNNGKISVIKVLENCDIPNPDSVENRKYKEKIKEPLLNTLDYLKSENVIASYDFHDASGKIYSKYDTLALPIKKFMGLIINYKML